METREGGGDGWGGGEGWGQKGRKLYLNNNKIRKYLIKKKIKEKEKINIIH